MLQATKRITFLAILFTGFVHAASGGETKDDSVDLDIVSQLDVKTTVKVHATSSDSRMPSLDLMTAACVEKAPKLRLALDQGNAVYFIVPLQLVKKVTATDKGHRLILADDSEHLGKILTTVTTKDGKTYDLGAASTFANANAAKPQKLDEKVQRLTLTIPKHGVASYEVIRPRIRTERLGADPLTMTFAGKSLQANLSDFDKVALVKKGKVWEIHVTPPGAAEKQGELVMRNGWWFFGCETTNGGIVMLRGQLEDARFPDNPGFTLEKAKSRSAGEK